MAESDKIRSYAYAGGAATRPRLVADGLPDAKSADLGGQYAHALKSVAVGPDHALYFSIGSSDNISADDRDASPQRATIMRVPPGGGQAQVFARGVRNGTGLAIAPDGAVWTAVNNRDNAVLNEVEALLNDETALLPEAGLADVAVGIGAARDQRAPADPGRTHGERERGRGDGAPHHGLRW